MLTQKLIAAAGLAAALLFGATTDASAHEWRHGFHSERSHRGVDYRSHRGPGYGEHRGVDYRFHRGPESRGHEWGRGR
jgi:hypothetical protein